MTYSAPTSANDILKSVTSVFKNTQDFDPVKECELEQIDTENIPSVRVLAPIPENNPLPVEDFSKIKMHDICFEDPWKKGRRIL